MASHKSVTTHRTSKKTVTAARTAVTLATATVGSIALLPGLAHADPATSAKDAKNRVDDLRNQAEVASENFNAANDKYTALQSKVTQIQSKISLEQADIVSAQTSLGSLAAAQYKSGGIDDTLQLMLKNSPDSYLQQASALSEISGHQVGALKSAQEAKRQLLQDQGTAADDLSKLKKGADDMAAYKAQIADKEKQAQSLLDSLTPDVRTQYNAIVKSSTPSGPTSAAIASLPVPADSRAAVAVAFAKAQLGKPYVYGAAGPHAFDCSGLMMAAWGAAGVKMDHGTWSQAASFPRVAEKDLQPGDLIFYYGGLSHVAMYVGNGLMLEAPHTGSVVRYSPVHLEPYEFAVRP